MIFYEKNGDDASLTARHFGVSRKTFHKWRQQRFETNFLKGLEDESRAPVRVSVRRREYTARQYDNVAAGALSQETFR